MKRSNWILGFANFLIIAGLIVGGILYTKHEAHWECVGSFKGPIFAIGIIALLISVAGCAGGLFRITCLLWVYIFALLLISMVLLIFTIVVVTTTKPGGGDPVIYRGYKEYHLEDYGNFLVARLGNGRRWNNIRSCFVHMSTCMRLPEKYPNRKEFFAAHLSPAESGCCKPPSSCQFAYVNATRWIHPKAVKADPDCYRWSNDQQQLCTACDSCKAAVLQILKNMVRKNVAGFTGALFALLLLGIIMGCCAFRNAGARVGYFKL